MFGMNHDFAKRLQAKKQEKAMLDGINEAIEQIEYDPISERQAIADIGNMRMAAMWVVLSLAKIISETDASDEDALLPNEVLDGLILEVLDTDDEEADADGLLRATLTAHVVDALSTLGVDDGVIDDLFSADFDVADSAIENAVETVLDELPDDGEPLDELFAAFAYGYDEEEAFDGAMFDKKQPLAVGKMTTKKVGGKTVKYQAIKAVKDGKVIIKNKRIGGGKIKLSSAQKQALAKARKKAHVGSARARRLRSIEKGIRKGVYGKSLQKNKFILKMSKASAGKNVG